MTPRTRLAAVLAAGLALAGCVGDGDDLINTPNIPAQGGTLFTRYVAMGNSITAGYQSGGIVDSTQVRAYPVLLAQRAGITSFGAPLLAKPGCPAPFVTFLGGTPAGTPPCALRDTTAAGQRRLIGNVAVPGATIADLFRFPNPATEQGRYLLTTLLTGNRTQVQAMQEADPTFVSVWIGNNDALAAALGGNLGPASAGADSTLTPLSSFQASLTQLVAAIDAEQPQGVMVIGVVDAVLAAPLIQPGAYFFAARDVATNRFQGKLVNANCSPINSLGQPNPLSRNMVSFQIITNTNFPEINCDPAAYPVGDPRRGALLLDVTEQGIVQTRIAQFNAALQTAAAARPNWLYVNPNEILLPFLNERDTQGRAQRIRKCQGLATATNQAQIQTAVLTTCPVPPTGTTAPFAAPNFFGSLISFDGVHPSSEAHDILARAFAQRINAKFGTALLTS